MLLLEEGQFLRASAAPRLPDEYNKAIDGARIGPREGSCGAAAYRAEPVIVDDIATHANWANYKHLALPYGLRACWSTPILSPSREVLGTFAMYYAEPRRPTPDEIELVGVATQLATIAIQRDRAEQLMRKSETRYRQLARLYAVSSTVNEAIVRVRDAMELYAFATRIAVEQGLARLAWIALCDATTGRITPVARAGHDDGYVDEIARSLNASHGSTGPGRRALATGVCATSDDIATDPDFHAKEPALARGFRSCAVFPLVVDGSAIGIFALYGERVGGFSAEELQILNALAGDIAFAVKSAETERELRRTEDALHEGERLRAQIYSSVADIIFSLVVEDGGNTFRFQSVNAAFLRATGINESDVVGRTVDEIIPEPSRTLVLQKYREAIARRAVVTWDEVTVYPSGMKHGEVSVAPFFDDAGRCTHLVGTVHDVTERRRAEDEHRKLESQLHQSQRVQSLGTLAGGIAHDFNNILTAIRGHTDLALMEKPENPGIQESLTEISAATTRATELVRQILRFSRQDEPRPEPLKLERVVREAIGLLKVSLPGGIQLRVRFDENTPPVLADATQLHQILMNLGTNAVHAMAGRSGVIEIRGDGVDIDEAASDTLPELAPGRYARIRVRDEGRGMDRATLERVFEPFFTTKPSGQGTGLGLSVVHGIMRRHKGTVTVDSELGVGTTFTLYFPASERPARPSAPAARVEAPAGERILYVDDDTALLFLTSRILTRVGYDVTTHASAAQALEAFRAAPNAFDAVVADIGLPGTDGVEFAREVRAIRPGVRVALVSGYVRDEDVERARAAGLGGIVLKPQSLEEFADVIRRTLRG